MGRAHIERGGGNESSASQHYHRGADPPDTQGEGTAAGRGEGEDRAQAGVGISTTADETPASATSSAPCPCPSTPTATTAHGAPATTPWHNATPATHDDGASPYASHEATNDG